jgi:hypothetical protein
MTSYRNTKLDLPSLDLLKRRISTHGFERTATDLGCSLTILDKLRSDIGATKPAVERIQAKLAALQ